jgi:hypothetical protein
LALQNSGAKDDFKRGFGIGRRNFFRRKEDAVFVDGDNHGLAPNAYGVEYRQAVAGAVSEDGGYAARGVAGNLAAPVGLRQDYLIYVDKWHRGDK